MKKKYAWFYLGTSFIFMIVFISFSSFADTDSCNIQFANFATDGKYNSISAIAISKIDDAGAGYCAAGVENILVAQGYPNAANLKGNAYTWATTLPQNGWVLVPNATPGSAPEGAILVYDRNNPPGTNGHGAEYGHVEIVSYDSSGNRVYVADQVYNNPGGSVPQNFVGAYVFVGTK